jgi:hypothetical protein
MRAACQQWPHLLRQDIRHNRIYFVKHLAALRGRLKRGRINPSVVEQDVDRGFLRDDIRLILAQPSCAIASAN